MSNMTKNEEHVYHRPPWDPDGILRARRELRLGDRVVAPFDRLPKDHGLDARTIRVMWDQGAIDTMPRRSGTFFRATPGDRVDVRPGGR